MSEPLDDTGLGPTVARAEAFLRSLALASPADGDASRIDRIRVFEDLKAALAAAQARETVAFKRSQLVEQQASGVHARDLGRGIAAQVALARRESPFKGGRLVGLAEALVSDMPGTLAAMTAGQVSEWRATLMLRETACLSAEHRATVDARLADTLGRLSDGQVARQARRLAYALDPVSFVARSEQAIHDRRVTLRPAADAMAILTALLPVTQGVACLAALKHVAATGKASGDARGEGQLMADVLVERVTGQAAPSEVPVAVQLLVTDTTLLGGGDEPGRIDGYGPIPAPVARHLVRDLPDTTYVWLRRLYTDPVTGRMTRSESHRRCFEGALRRTLIVRDETCRAPYCDGAIKHLDHVVGVAPRDRDDAAGGDTSESNGQGLCAACNYVKAMPGWRARPDPSGGAGVSVATTTPTGHSYTSVPPPLPGGWPGDAGPPLVHPRRLPPIDVYYLPPASHVA